MYRLGYGKDRAISARGVQAIDMPLPRMLCIALVLALVSTVISLSASAADGIKKPPTRLHGSRDVQPQPAPSPNPDAEVATAVKFRKTLITDPTRPRTREGVGY